ncbi:MAG: SAM-dependent methyltransferase [Bacteroidales bacterium]|jgi:16S rRNA (cytidine1402-2'-O)-methyltransferase|nr:SAM-dependent methyltransferase [Bacteroidales bacterium]
MKGCLYLIPVTLGGENYSELIPAGVLDITRRLRYFIAEDIRSARRYLRLIDRNFPIDEASFSVLNEHSTEEDLSELAGPLLQGNDAGVISEAGMPAIADPGSKIVLLAHRMGIRVVPLSGPSSILMALIASGLNGQSFTFNGYLPVKAPERDLRLREIEKRAREGYAQVFMETPYRNQKMLEAVTRVCSSDRFLTIACDISLPGETIRTRRIAEWKTQIPELTGRLAVFVLQ